MDDNQAFKVFGVGFPRSGTSSLKMALKEMGFKAGGPLYIEDPEVQIHVGDWMLLPNDKFKEMDVKFPNAKFIFTERKDADTWYESVEKRTKVVGHNLGIRKQRKSMYGHATPLRPLYLARYYKHKRDVFDYFNDKYGDKVNEKLLSVCWDRGDGWRELSTFLQCMHPNLPFPHLNKSK